NGHDNFLHDGSARSLLEAVIWQGSEVDASRHKGKAMSAAERNALIKFLESF
ncbi:MAG: thiol oxidoreductase, partial [Chitinophagaceae bacterium]|nr:thiol oxidoreductase [Chitinophagaceae bacterium]